MKTAAARLVTGAAAAAGVAGLGSLVRGPLARPSLPRDLAAGAAVIAAAAVLQWAIAEQRGTGGDGST